jgi:hypothetical protein
MPSIIPKIPKIWMRLDCSILHNFIIHADYILPIEIKLKILEQIQYLNLL